MKRLFLVSAIALIGLFSGAVKAVAQDYYSPVLAALIEYSELEGAEFIEVEGDEIAPFLADIGEEDMLDSLGGQADIMAALALDYAGLSEDEMNGFIDYLFSAFEDGGFEQMSDEEDTLVYVCGYENGTQFIIQEFTTVMIGDEGLSVLTIIGNFPVEM